MAHAGVLPTDRAALAHPAAQPPAPEKTLTERQSSARGEPRASRVRGLGRDQRYLLPRSTAGAVPAAAGAGASPPAEGVLSPRRAASWWPLAGTCAPSLCPGCAAGPESEREVREKGTELCSPSERGAGHLLAAASGDCGASRLLLYWIFWHNVPHTEELVSFPRTR